MITSDQQIYLQIYKEVQAAPQGKKDAVKKAAGIRYGKKVSTINYNLAKIGGRKRKRRSTAGKPNNPAKRAKEIKVLEIIYEPIARGEVQRRMPATTAIKIAEMNGIIEPGELTADSVNKTGRKLGMTDKKRCRRFDEPLSNGVHLLDGSGSEYIGVIKKLPGGDALCESRTKKRKAQKNRRIKNGESAEDAETGLMFYYYCVVDMHSRLIFLFTKIVSGESMADGVLALQRAWEQKSDHPMVGLPDTLYTDNGSLAKSNESLGLLKELGVNIVTHMPYKSRAKGGVERVWRNIWMHVELQFTREPGRKWLKSEIDKMIQNYVAEYNAKKSPGHYANGRSRQQTYIEDLQARQVRLLPQGISLLEMLVTTAFRTVTQYCTVKWDGVEYEIIKCPASMVGEKVLCQRSAGGDVEVRNPATREWMPTKAHRPHDFGTYRGFENDINDELLASAKIAPAPEKYLFEERPASADEGNVVALAAFGQEAGTRRVEPLRGFKSAQACWSWLADMLGDAAWTFVPEDQRDDLTALIEENYKNRQLMDGLLKGLMQMRDERDALERQSNNA